MKKKVMIITYVILILLMIKFSYNSILNLMIINQYKNGDYNENKVKYLTFFNFPQNYIVYYNYGNILYMKGNYSEAIEKYKKSLNGYVPKSKECDIRTNYALALCKTVELNEEDENSINNAIKIYESAISVLIEKGCANENDNNGHDEEAQQLKNDIQKEIDRLKNLTSKEENKEENKEQNNNQENSEEDVENKINEIKGKSTIEQRESEGRYEERNINYNSYNKKYW